MWLTENKDNLRTIICKILIAKCNKPDWNESYLNTHVLATTPNRPCLVPRRLSFDENVRAKECGKETTLPMVPCGSSPVTRFALAPAMRKTKRLRRRLKQTSFPSPTGARRQCGEQEHAQFCTNHDITSGWSCRRLENVSILSSLLSLRKNGGLLVVYPFYNSWLSIRRTSLYCILSALCKSQHSRLFGPHDLQ